MKIIGIHGLKGSGKTTFANMLATEINDNHGRKCTTLPFASPLKTICMVLFGGTKEMWYGTDQDKNVALPYWADALGEKYSTPRRILQTIGTDIFRKHVGETFWLLTFNKNLADLPSKMNPDFVFTDDVRFDNEANYIRTVNGQMITVQRMGVTQSTDGHASEAGITISDKDLLFNFNSLDNMKQCVRQIAPSIVKNTKEVDLCSWLKSSAVQNSSVSQTN